MDDIMCLFCCWKEMNQFSGRIATITFFKCNNAHVLLGGSVDFRDCFNYLDKFFRFFGWLITRCLQIY